MNTVTFQTPGRQGDVFVERVESLPAGLVEAERDSHGRIILANGETSGHAHAIRDRSVVGFRTESAETDAARAGLNAEIDYILVGGSGATLNHELVSGQKAEHEPLTLPEGVYKITGQREYQPAGIQRAVD